MDEMMRQWQLPMLGLRNLELASVPMPKPADGELLIRAAAVSLNYRDTMEAEGNGVPVRATLPFVPGSDMVGEVVAVGAGVSRFGVGDRVLGNFWTRWIDGKPGEDVTRDFLSLGGALPGVLAEYVVLHEDVAVRAPTSLTDEQAATLPVTGLTAWYALVTKGALKVGETVLVQGTGGVSLSAFQIARGLGARVIVTSRSAQKLERMKALGASDVIDTSKNAEWAKVALKLTNGRGVDHVLEMLGGANVAQSAAAVANGGRITLIGFLNGMEMTVPTVPLALKGVVVQGISVGHRQAFEEMNRAVDQYGIKPLIDRTYAFSDVPEAFAHLKQGAFGKIVIKVSG